MTSPNNPMIAALTHAVLRQGRIFNLLSAVFWLALLSPRAHPTDWSLATLLAGIALGLGHTYAAIRTGIDAELFTHLARPSMDEAPLEHLDEALHELGWLRQKPQPRPLVERAQTAQRWFFYQAVGCLLQGTFAITTCLLSR